MIKWFFQKMTITAVNRPWETHTRQKANKRNCTHFLDPTSDDTFYFLITSIIGKILFHFFSFFLILVVKWKVDITEFSLFFFYFTREMGRGELICIQSPSEKAPEIFSFSFSSAITFSFFFSYFLDGNLFVIPFRSWQKNP